MGERRSRGGTGRQVLLGTAHGSSDVERLPDKSWMEEPVGAARAAESIDGEQEGDGTRVSMSRDGSSVPGSPPGAGGIWGIGLCRTRRRVEGALWVVALVCAGYCAVMYGRAQSLMHTPLPAAPIAGVAVPRPADVRGAGPEPGTLIAHLDIPKIGLSVPVLEDDEAQSLTRGVGHIRETAMPGGLGTVGLAGHRDTFLRPLSRIAPKMEIRLTDASGVYRYVVDSTEIVMPEEVRVLDIVDVPSLVIVTCYPFHYIGAAPKRFIVHAHLVSVVPG